MMKIEYKFESPDAIENIFFQGGIRISYNNLIITKHIDDQNDDGFRGDYLYDNMAGLLKCIQQLIDGEPCKVEFLDYLNEFAFQPDNSDHILIIFRTLGDGTDIQLENRRYPNNGEGIIIPLSEFAYETIKVGQEFISDIKKRIINQPNGTIDKFKTDISRFESQLSDTINKYNSRTRMANAISWTPLETQTG